MSLNDLSRALYQAARLTRDIQAVKRSAETGSLKPVGKRLAWKAGGRTFGSLFGRLFR